jgi:hypothetical protein
MIINEMNCVQIMMREQGVRSERQVTSKGAVVGKLDQLRAEKARQELAEGLGEGKGYDVPRYRLPLDWDALKPDD